MALAPKDVFDMGGAMGSMSTTVYLGALVPFTLKPLYMSCFGVARVALVGALNMNQCCLRCSPDLKQERPRVCGATELATKRFGQKVSEDLFPFFRDKRVPF